MQTFQSKSYTRFPWSGGFIPKPAPNCDLILVCRPWVSRWALQQQLGPEGNAPKALLHECQGPPKLLHSARGLRWLEGSRKPSLSPTHSETRTPAWNSVGRRSPGGRDGGGATIAIGNNCPNSNGLLTQFGATMKHPDTI